MKLQTCYVTDVGIRKATNQDSLCIEIANTNSGRVALALVCDGMGGLAKGEVASAALITAFRDWFATSLPQLLQDGFSETVLLQQWNDIIQTQNKRIAAYGARNGVQLGTTIVAALFYGAHYYLLNVGDSRVYEIAADSLAQLTRDQTLVQQEIEAGRLTPEQAAQDPRRSVLLQCVGASDEVVPEYIVGACHPNATYLLCSDGFRHKISVSEMHGYLNPSAAPTKEQLQQNAQMLVDLNKQRAETDNITVVLLQTSGIDRLSEATSEL